MVRIAQTESPFNQGEDTEAAAWRDLAVRIVAARYQLEPHVAHLVCELAHIGQEAA